MGYYICGYDVKYLSDLIIMIRNDCYVILVKVENCSWFGGIVYD